MELSIIIMIMFYCLLKIQIIDIAFTLDQGCFLCLFIDNVLLLLFKIDNNTLREFQKK